jgi:putative transcriptional regulator
MDSGTAAYNEAMAHAVRPGIAPALLLSMPQLVDPNFHRTVVLLCEHNAEGAFGLVINRPTDTSASQAVRLLPPPSRDGGLALWAGGPVEPQRGWILMGSEPAETEAVSVADGVYLSTSPLLLRSLIETAPPRTRVLTGYAGWGPGQLDAELARDDWFVAPAGIEDIFNPDADELWGRVLSRKGAHFALVARMPIDPSVN